MQGFGLFLLRLTVGVVSIAHGLPKLLPIWGSDPQATAALFESVALEPAYPIAVCTGITEVLAGTLLIAGAYTFWVTLLLTATTVAIGWRLYLPNGFFLNWGVASWRPQGDEFDLLLLVAALICLMVAGPGFFSVDARRVRVAESLKLSRARALASKS